ncbi:MAG: hypothetical protein ABW221_15000 [Vicinamibacteria bacterium]
MIQVLAFLAAAAAVPAPAEVVDDASATFACSEAVQDGGFEAGVVPTFWTQSSTNFGTPICSVALCGDGGGSAAARSGTFWTWLGGAELARSAAVSQSATLAPGVTRLRFYLWIGARSGNGTDAFRVLLDGTPIFTATEATPGYDAYTLVDLDLSAFATGGSHVLRFEGTTSGPEITNFNVDDVSLQTCPVGATTIVGELNQGFERSTNLAATPAAARHVYRLARPPYSSWETVVDGTSGDIDAGSGPSLVRLAADLTTVLQSSLPAGFGTARRLATVNATAAVDTDYVEIRSLGCTTNCGTDDVYRIRARETTLSAPRFNNTGGQVTVVLLQERTGSTVGGTVWFWSAAGGLLGSQAFTLAPRQGLVLNSTTVPGVANQGGAVTVTHDGPYGGLAGKAVALEPATGFSFDTPLEPRRH